MLDFGFSEILLTSAIALVVLGPERLPKVARQVVTWVGRARVMARQLTEQLEREVNADELMKQRTKAAASASAPSADTPPASTPPTTDLGAHYPDPLPPTAPTTAMPPPPPETPHPNSPAAMHASTPPPAATSDKPPNE
jgi:sec-independent protein translocase protein TatB